MLSEPLEVEASVAQVGENQWVLSIAWRHAYSTSQRSYEADSCTDLARIAALSTALIVDPSALAPRVPPKAEPPTTNTTSLPSPVIRVGVVSAPQGMLYVKPPASIRKEYARHPHGALSFGASTAVGILPTLAIGAEAGTKVEIKTASFYATLRSYIPQIWLQAGYDVMLWPSEFAVGPCYAFGSRRLRMVPCLETSAQLYFGQAGRRSAFSEGTASWTWAWRLGGGLGIEYAISRSWTLATSAWALAAVARPDFRLHPEIQLFRPSPLEWRVAFGVAMALF